MSKANGIIVAAYKKGYRVTDDGTPISHKGNVLSLNVPNGRRYPKLAVVVDGKCESVLLHRFAAYCFYKEELFNKDLQVRHLNGDTQDISRKNIALGTAKENQSDKSFEAKMRTTDAVIKSSVGRPPVNRSLTELQVESIREKLAGGARGMDIAIEYGVTRNVISGIKTGRYYDI